ncbi:TonB-dependent receptor plug domain-containing protein [Vibrio splendidus]|uniref:TonB-dependent receptor plug domain-containing protein n=1 Tax=Vibrio splendidus TaxID=29497 RepID=UPI0024684252|nr:TonB-dependent receptor plug domain-containing protein [Vibrio splendidus]MDH5912716.1 TonB-dependent receptor plug domain-containing protein [Vibrio splendidus]MDH5941434.1 TonB-dependent receptor plug domain-containing protein [Vibrio splendidus]MDH5986639.1 TonB-dependent receptor plug domain-containing protein [Vibrio splendidus]MDH5992908.1 TonB-dependent receptor plug domain-containing protein [Vibrio splendidus]MDH6006316.1 TonB-dependent receptor plug domain-containing protein [Vibr
MHPFNKTILAATIASLCSVSSVYAETEQTSNTQADLTVNVTDTRDDDLSTKQTLDADDIKDTPSSNGNLTDYLKDNPNVRFAGGDLDGFQGGEIKPVSVSIHGADSSQTSYMIDGVNVNNDLDPNNQLFDGTMQVNPQSQSEQAYFLDANLLSGVTVYSSDVPAQFGGFTGGTVVAETRQYVGEDKVRLSYRTTQSDWAEMKVDPNAKAVVEKASPKGIDSTFQPVYKKEFFSVSAEQAITDDIGMVIGFSRRDSDIQQSRLLNPQGKTDKQNHTRRSDNFLANVNWVPSTARSVELGLRLSDYNEGKYYETNVNGDVTDSHLGYGSTLTWNEQLGKGRLSVTAAYDKFQDERESSSNDATVYVDAMSSFSYEEGGYGDSQLTQENTTFRVDYSLDRLALGSTFHAISFGAEYRKTDYEFNRDYDVTQRMVMDFGGGFTYDETKTLNAGKVNTGYQNYAFYVEDKIKWGSVSIRPGVRVDRDDFLENTNIAPRLATRWQILPDTRLNFGLNRYYGRSFAAMKLAGEVSELNKDETRNYESLNSLDTSYSDELSFGVTQNVGNFVVAANYVLRDHQKRIMTEEKDVAGKTVTYYSNGHDYKVDTYTLQVSNIKPWVLGPTLWTTTLAADWLTTDRADLNKSFVPNELVFLDGKLMKRSEMEQEVNSSSEEWVLRLGLDMNIPSYDLLWANKVYVKAPVKGYKHVTDDGPDKRSMYASYNYGTHTQWDTRIRYQPNLFGTHSAYLQLDVLNVLNQVRQSGVIRGDDGDYGIYSPGREFWLELGYEF